MSPCALLDGRRIREAEATQTTAHDPRATRMGPLSLPLLVVTELGSAPKDSSLALIIPLQGKVRSFLTTLALRAAAGVAQIETSAMPRRTHLERNNDAMADNGDPDDHNPHEAVARSGPAAVRPRVRKVEEDTTMLKVMNSRRPGAQGLSWAMTLCMGAGLVILILGLVQLLR